MLYLCQNENKRLDTQHKHTGRCGIVFRNGSFREYATEMLEKGKGDGSVFRVCEIAPEIAIDLSIRGKTLLNKDIIITHCSKQACLRLHTPIS